VSDSESSSMAFHEQNLLLLYSLSKKPCTAWLGKLVVGTKFMIHLALWDPSVSMHI
jgi:hypothetical protein